MTSRVVAPKSRRLSISGEDWLLVKDRLTAGERDDYLQGTYATRPDGSYILTPTGRFIVDPVKSRVGLIAAFLIDWSLTGPDGQPITIAGQPVAVVEAALRVIDPESQDEIRAAIEAHDQAMAIERAAQKKILSGEPASPSTSPSPGPAAGHSTGSVT